MAYLSFMQVHHKTTADEWDFWGRFARFSGHLYFALAWKQLTLHGRTWGIDRPTAPTVCMCLTYNSISYLVVPLPKVL